MTKNSGMSTNDNKTNDHSADAESRQDILLDSEFGFDPRQMQNAKMPKKSPAAKPAPGGASHGQLAAEVVSYCYGECTNNTHIDRHCIR